MLKQRIFTALVLAPLVLLALFGLADVYLMLLFAAIIIAGACEWWKLAEIAKPSAKLLFLLGEIILIAITWRLAASGPDVVAVILSSAVLGWFMILFWLAMYERGKLTIRLTVLSRVLLGFILLPICFLGIAFILHSFENDRLLVLLLFVLIWGADVAAYFSGRAFGKHKLAPLISPGKSWEGVIGALLGTMIIASVAGWLLNYSGHFLPKLVLLSLLVVALSVVGDLFESLLKRQVGIKDSSNVLPGHGGVLDRIDSLIAASPVYALGIYLLGMS